MVAQGAATGGSAVVIALGRIMQIGAAALLMLTLAGAQNSALHLPPAKEQTALVRAETAMDQQQWTEAETILRKLVAGNTQDARAWFDLGYVMHAQQNYPKAIFAYRGAVAAQPDSFECNFNLGMMLAHENDPDASKYLEAATRLKPTSANPQKSLAHAWAALARVQAPRNFKSSVDSWSHAAALAPDDAQNRLEFGEALDQSGDLAGAEREFRNADELQPMSRDVLTALSNLYVRTQRMPQAEETLRRLVSEAPQTESGHLQLGRVLSAEKKDAEAVAELQKALALRTDDWDALRELAFVQERDKQFAAAEASYRTLLMQFPNDAELHNGLGSVLLPQLKYEEAQTEFVVCLRLKPDWGEAYGQLALAASGNKDYELAIKALDGRRKRLPELPGTYFLRATCHDHLRQFADAVENYKAFLAVSNGQFPDDEWKARHRLIAIEPEAKSKRK
jgi:tetratricopeptide (TPR) repeat protein